MLEEAVSFDSILATIQQPRLGSLHDIEKDGSQATAVHIQEVYGDEVRHRHHIHCFVINRYCGLQASEIKF